jgi:limonene-1,2-epoxide hydrolase
MKWFQEYGDCNHMKFTVLQIAQDGDWVLAERREEWTVNGVTTEMDVMGKFLVRDGKIHAWLDYFPYIAHWEAAKQMPEGFFKRWEDPVSVVKK